MDSKKISIYEMSTTSPIYRQFKKHGTYICSGFFPDITFGKEISLRKYNQNIMMLSFEKEMFDIVISSETMEHVSDPLLGFKEIYRVLKPGGIHCFTIPFTENTVTVKRAESIAGETVHHLQEKYHKDPYSGKCLVYTDFGEDLFGMLSDIGFETVVYHICEEFYDIQDDMNPVRVFLSRKL